MTIPRCYVVQDQAFRSDAKVQESSRRFGDIEM